MTTYTSMTPAGVIAASTAGSVLGAVILYYAGRLIPREHMSRLLDGKVGNMLHFQKEDVGDAVEWFERRGMAAVLICRCVPIIRSLISLPPSHSRRKPGVEYSPGSGRSHSRCILGEDSGGHGRLLECGRSPDRRCGLSGKLSLFQKERGAGQR